MEYCLHLLKHKLYEVVHFNRQILILVHTSTGINAGINSAPQEMTYILVIILRYWLELISYICCKLASTCLQAHCTVFLEPFLASSKAVLQVVFNFTMLTSLLLGGYAND